MKNENEAGARERAKTPLSAILGACRRGFNKSEASGLILPTTPKELRPGLTLPKDVFGKKSRNT